jgi:hypothetical protein
MSLLLYNVSDNFVKAEILGRQVTLISHIPPYLLVYTNAGKTSKAGHEKLNFSHAPPEVTLRLCYPEKQFGVRWRANRYKGIFLVAVDFLGGISLQLYVNSRMSNGVS